MKTRKYNIILFHDLSSKSKAANIYSQFQLVKLLQKENALDKVYCMNCFTDDRSLKQHVVELNKSFEYKLKDRLLSWLYKAKSRSKRESLFEKHVLKSLKKSNSERVYMSKPLFPNICSYIKEVGGKTFVRASIAHPRFNFNLVNKEQKKIGFDNFNSYVDSVRVAKIETCIQNCSYLLVNCRSKESNFLLNTYSDFKEKIIPYECMYIKMPSSINKLPDDTVKKVKFLHVSHGNLIKGIQYLFMAWDKYQKKTSAETELHIVGSFDQNIQAIYDENYKSLKKIILHPASKNPFDIVESPSAFINMSLSEAGPSTIAESLCKGIPVISSKSSGLSDLIKDGYNGFTYEYDNVDQLVSHLEWFDNNKTEIKQLKKNALDSYSKYDFSFFEIEMKNILLS